MWKPRSSVLPLSDHDNAHLKQRSRRLARMFRSGRFLTAAVAVGCLMGFLFVWHYSLNPDNGHQVVPSGKEAVKPGAVADTSSFECTKSYDGKTPVEQYVVMIDAGSSGSRVHVYRFNNCQAMPRLMGEEFKMIDGGLSSYADDPVAAAKSLDVLLKVALDSIPENQQGCSPIAVKATAGLRKLGDKKSEIILGAVKKHLEDNYPFPVVKNGVTIMPGEEEGVYAWVTANYLLGNIGTKEDTPTVAVFDLGGGSTQIVFEPKWKDASKQLTAGDHRFELSFGGRDFVLYQHSYLGYGLNEARSKINSLATESQINGSQLPESLVHPCLPPGSSKSFEVEVPDGTASLDGPVKTTKKVLFKGSSEPSPLQCRALAEKILAKDAVCANPPCAFDGVHQPPLFEAFPSTSEMYVFSFFYDRTFPLGMPSVFTLDELRDLQNKVCKGPDAYSSFTAIRGAVDAIKEHPDWCLDLSYMLTLLRTGYDLHGSREVKIAKKINGNELGWCLGASLPLLDGVDWKCRETAG
ncbi:Guanosine-diphosphatase [Wickerhamiella sorbophila]|uniref:guanosine-diphosphatase n=1 Tax=Wickerhamiella sorbophila TaxID=45607 RepID=A0A2T0FPS8_9ASCO|nr:Guanosine-diphosphatase [Wickerhamiella sorbophila]PRT56991.1 Guanosine-diphosphatase [Wickerhamiella sorbophila]